MGKCSRDNSKIEQIQERVLLAQDYYSEIIKPYVGD